MVSGGLGLSLDPLHHSLGGLRMRSESTHQPTHTPTDSLLDPAPATVATTDHLSRALPLRQVSRRQDHRHLGTRAEREARVLYAHGEHDLQRGQACGHPAYRQLRAEHRLLNFLPAGPWAGPCESDWTRRSPPA